MCGIVASFDKDKFVELMKLNMYRGNFSYSIMCYDFRNKKVISLYKLFGEFNENILNNFDNENVYYIGHQQSPTNGLVKDINRIHPSEYNNSYLYHNGMLKDSFLKKYNWCDNWDTKLLHQLINDNMDNLDNIEGSFSCLYINDKGDIMIFRNQLSPLFVDDNLNISSTKFDNSKKTVENKIFCINFEDVSLVEKNNFNNKENIYFL